MLCYHGCRRGLAERVFAGEGHLPASNNKWDWLGTGIYFWESDPLRGLEWAKDRYAGDAAVVGAAIHLGRCLNLISRQATGLLATAYADLEKTAARGAHKLPKNTITGGHFLDRMVIEWLHYMREKKQEKPAFDTVRGLFQESNKGAAFPDSMFMSHSHVQLCVRSTQVIKGYFRVPEEHLTALQA